jgi:hypothetical protein
MTVRDHRPVLDRWADLRVIGVFDLGLATPGVSDAV